ncbi:UNVERIFIED_CONTAM: hypothetical protein Slati_0034300 [Sesamum latifolium]|uniref:Remorin C-terminal domain-containing protein n=1 Tax=Sesamum latifolium TaxID=2727402 RepID=A0AAW2Y7J6_9LAMI
MKRNSGAYTSPGTPEYGVNNPGEIPKSWHSERVPLPMSRRHINAAALMPFNSGRALPSKWDDAERWITSPISAHSSAKSLASQPQRRPKSKSGPLGPPGLVYLSNFSPTLEGGNLRSFIGNSPLATGVLAPDGLSIHYDAAKSNSSCSKDNITRSTSVPGMSDLLDETAMPSSQGDKVDGSKEEEAVVYRRDMATQMSPEGSTHSSSRGRLSFSTLPSSVPAPFRPHSNHAAKDEIRDVQVDKGTTMARQSKKQGIKKMKKDSTNVDDLPLPWNGSEVSKNASRLQREEAKITAWENLQKAKAEAAIRKLEMKLEKERSASMDKILNKLRAAEMKARAMRDSLSENQQPRARRGRTSCMGFSCCIYVKAYHLSNCFLARRK